MPAAAPSELHDLLGAWAVQELPPMAHAGGKMDSQYEPAIGQAILGRIWLGQTVKEIAADPAMPSYATIYQWRRLHEDFRNGWDDLRAAMAALRLAAREEARARAVAGRRRRGRTGGQRSTYTPQMAEAVCEHIEAGWSMSEVARAPGLPSAKAIHGWLRNRPEFRARYGEACGIRAALLSEWIYDVALRSSVVTFEEDRREVARLEGRIGVTTPRLYRTDRGAA